MKPWVKLDTNLWHRIAWSIEGGYRLCCGLEMPVDRIIEQRAKPPELAGVAVYIRPTACIRCKGRRR